MNDILRITQSIVQRDFDISAFLVAALFYLIFTFILTNIFNYLERRFARENYSFYTNCKPYRTNTILCKKGEKGFRRSRNDC